MDLSLFKVLCTSFSELLDRKHFAPVADGAGPEQMGMEILEKKPVILGGSPTDPANKILVDRKKHIQAVNCWNKIIHDLREGAWTRSKSEPLLKPSSSLLKVCLNDVSTTPAKTTLLVPLSNTHANL
jgi:hypothetical protein